MAMTALTTLAASIPSPPQSTWQLGPLTIRAYGIMIAIGMIVAVILTQRRYQRRGGDPDIVVTVALWAIPFGIVGARLYHVITSPARYFGEGGNPVEILYIWHGGMGIWGGVALGALGGWIALHRAGLRVGPFVDSVAPTLLIAQAIGRLGNWFNQELFGGPTDLPWGLQIDDAHLPAGFASGTLFHPTFLYEGLWNLAMAALLIYLDRRLSLRGGQLIWMYVMAYTAGRVWIETIRIDTANLFLGQRINVWIMAVTFLIGLAGFFFARRVGASTYVGTPAVEENNVE